uniref:B-cell receptor CD22 n=1 Tax=Anabas testudineus TaxID=64144 RepID=A0A7N6BWS7_ANATE
MEEQELTEYSRLTVLLREADVRNLKVTIITNHKRRAEDSGNRSRTVVKSQNGWGVTYRKPTEICALKGSTVTISCTYGYPYTVERVDKTLWFTKESNNVHVDLRSDPDYSDRVEYQCENKACTLTIRDLRETDSATYKFRFITNLETGRYTGEPGVTLSVTDLQVQVITSTYRRSELRCLNRCSLPDRFTYIWYKNGQNIQGQTSNTYSGYFVDTDRVSCAVRGQELFPSPSVSVHWGVTYTSTQICGSKGSTVDIHCSYRYPSRVNNVDTRVTKTFWFVNNEPLDLKEDSDYSGRVEDQCNGNSCTLTIRDLRETDSAEYKFKFITNHDSGKYTGSPGVVLSFSDPQFQVDVRKSTVDQFSTWTELTCRSNYQLFDHHSYIWYKNGEKVENKGKKYFLLDGFDPSNRYYCNIEVLGYERFRSPPVYAPNLPLVSVLPSGQIKKGSSVTMSCSSDANPAAKYTWYKKNGTDEPRLVDQERLSFSSIQSSDSGDYYCTAENELGRTRSEIISIDVKYPPHPPSVSVSPSEIVEGSSVTLNCSSDANPAATYTWYKGNRQHVHG